MNVLHLLSHLFYPIAFSIPNCATAAAPLPMHTPTPVVGRNYAFGHASFRQQHGAGAGVEANTAGVEEGSSLKRGLGDSSLLPSASGKQRVRRSDNSDPPSSNVRAANVVGAGRSSATLLSAASSVYKSVAAEFSAAAVSGSGSSSDSSSDSSLSSAPESDDDDAGAVGGNAKTTLQDIIRMDDYTLSQHVPNGYVFDHLQVTGGPAQNLASSLAASSNALVSDCLIISTAGSRCWPPAPASAMAARFAATAVYTDELGSTPPTVPSPSKAPWPVCSSSFTTAAKRSTVVDRPSAPPKMALAAATMTDARSRALAFSFSFRA